MSNPVCISPLKFYDSLDKQSHRKSYAYGHISPLITKTGWIPPFQFVIPDDFLFSIIDKNSEELDNVGYYKSYSPYDISPDDNLKHTDLIDITVYSSISYENVYISKQGFIAAFFDANGTIIPSISIKNNSDNVTFNSGTIDCSEKIAGGAKYVSFSTYKPNTQVENPIRIVFSGFISLDRALLYDIKTESVVLDIKDKLLETGFSIEKYEGYTVVIYHSSSKISSTIQEGLYYIKLFDKNGLVNYYSEVFCFDNVTKDCLELEYWNETGNFTIRNGVIAFPADFHFKLLLKGEIGKPEYNFEEESTKRLGYIYVESQVSKKTYKFNTIVPEYICDALRLVRLCDNKIIRCKDDEYEAITFEMEAEWQTQGDLASVTCEFETDNVIANIGGFVPDKLGGDYNNDYNEDFDKE